MRSARRCAPAREALAGFAPAKGRGERFTLQAPDGPFTLIDESYNANPISMRAALALLGAAKPGPGGRRIAVIGDMLELGARGRRRCTRRSRRISTPTTSICCSAPGR